MLCRRVQEERPRASTSGGHSAWEVLVVVVILGAPLVAEAAKAEKAAFELQARHLYQGSVSLA